MFFLLLTSFFVHADSPRKWENAKGIVERHEFYQNDELLLGPRSSWQPLFALTFLDSNFRLSKDCVYYRIPGEEPGKLKIKSVSADKDCSIEILAPGDTEHENISDFRFATDASTVTLNFKQAGRPVSWRISTLKDWKKPVPRLLLSSADYRSPRVTYLAAASTGQNILAVLKEGHLCHDVASDCSERSPSQCRNCEHGWQEIPNGCKVGPKICSYEDCGGKNRPACRRGMVWQRKATAFDCRTDSSFAWCSKGLRISCEGDRAYCR